MFTREHYEKMFDDADTDGDGYITFDELFEALKFTGESERGLMVGHGSLNGKIA